MVDNDESAGLNGPTSIVSNRPLRSTDSRVPPSVIVSLAVLKIENVDELLIIELVISLVVCNELLIGSHTRPAAGDTVVPPLL